MEFLKSEKGIRLCKMAGILMAAAAVAAYGVLGIWRHAPGWGDYFHGIVIVTLVLGLLMAAGIGYLLIYRKTKIEKIYPMAALFLAVMTFLALPTYSKPDEPQHFETAYELSNRMLGEAVGEGEYWFIINQRQCDHAYDGTALSVEQYNQFGDSYFTDQDGLRIDSFFDNISTKEILPYIIPALGISLGRILHLGFGGIAALGTLFSAAFFILMITYAMHKLPFGKRTLFVIALLPMTLQQANSFSYDCSLIAAGVVVTALALHWKYYSGRIHVSEVVMLVSAAVLLLFVKGGIYAPLLLFPILVVLKEKCGKRERILTVVAALLVAVIMIFSLLAFDGGERIADFLALRHYVVWAEAYGFSVWDYLTHPVYTLKILTYTAVHKGGYYILTMLGGLLGWIDITISKKVMLLVVLLLLLSLVRTKEDELPGGKGLLPDRGGRASEGALVYRVGRSMSRGSRILMVVISAGVCMMCILSMLVYWTPMFSAAVEGAQGRYFLPVLLPLLLGIGLWKKPALPHSTDGWIAAAMPIVDFAVILCIYINIITK